MKRILIFTFVFSFISFWGCEKENKAPTCEITSPEFGSIIKQGEFVTISVDARDEDGSIKEVRFYVDGVGKSSSKSFPYNYSWDTENAEQGNHTIRAVAIDDGNLEGEATLDITIESSNSGTFTDSRDGNSYEWVKIGTQTWMIENLAYLPSVSPRSTESVTAKHYYVYRYEGSSVSEAKATSNYDAYGVLYNWEAAMTVCPDGWDLPTDGDWKTLEKYLGMSSSDADDTGWRSSGDVGKKMKSTTLWSGSGKGDNSSGFNAFPSGSRTDYGGFSTLGLGAGYWSSTPNGSLYAWPRYLGSGYDGVGRYSGNRSYGYSVRCLHN